MTTVGILLLVSTGMTMGVPLVRWLSRPLSRPVWRV